MSKEIEDLLAHSGTRGMKWGVRRELDSTGRVAGASKTELSTKKAPKQSADHVKSIKALNKKVEHLSTKEIKELTSRLKAIDEFKKASAAEKAQNQSRGVRLAKWSANSIKKGVTKEAEKYLQAFGSDLASQMFKAHSSSTPKNRKETKKPTIKPPPPPKKTRKTKKNPIRVDAEFIQPQPNTPKPSPARQKELEQTVYKITTMGG